MGVIVNMEVNGESTSGVLAFTSKHNEQQIRNKKMWKQKYESYKGDAVRELWEMWRVQNNKEIRCAE